MAATFRAGGIPVPHGGTMSELDRPSGLIAISPRNAILPAFGGFTGLHVLDPSPTLSMYAVAGDELVRL